MRCRMTTCGTFTFEGKSRALPVTVTRCLRNIFRCRSARHWRGSVVMLNGDLWFNRGYRFNFCCDFSDDWRGRLSNKLIITQQVADAQERQRHDALPYDHLRHLYLRRQK